MRRSKARAKGGTLAGDRGGGKHITQKERGRGEEASEGERKRRAEKTGEGIQKGEKKEKAKEKQKKQNRAESAVLMSFLCA